MLVIKRTIYILLVILGSYSCSNGSRSVKQKEDFAVFFETYSADSNFQKSRMLLPLVSETKFKELKEEAYVTALLKNYHSSFSTILSLCQTNGKRTKDIK